MAPGAIRSRIRWPTASRSIRNAQAERASTASRIDSRSGDRPVLDAVRGDEERRGGRDGLEDAVPSIERPADLGLPDGRADDPGRGPQRVELRPGPVALLVGVVVADVAPPPAAARDRGHDDRADPVRLEEDPLLRGQLPEVPGDQVPGRQLALPAPEVAEPARVRRGPRGAGRRPRPTRRRRRMWEPSSPSIRSIRTTRPAPDAEPIRRRTSGRASSRGSPAMNRSAAKVTASRMTSRRSGPAGGSAGRRGRLQGTAVRGDGPVDRWRGEEPPRGDVSTRGVGVYASGPATGQRGGAPRPVRPPARTARAPGPRAARRPAPRRRPRPTRGRARRPARRARRRAAGPRGA